MAPGIQTMWRSWAIVGSLVVIAAVIAWRTGGPAKVGEALGSGAKLFVSILPSLILGVALAGFLYVLIPSETIGGWLGEESGLRGLLVGTVAGALTPGGPFTHFPIVASFLSKGAGVGPVCAYIAAWALLGVNRFLVWELPILGSQIALTRLVSSVWVPPLVGWLGAMLYRATTRV